MAYDRDYDTEYANSKKNGNYKKKLLRDQARRKMVKLGRAKKGDGKDIDHKVPLDHGGSALGLHNLRAVSVHANRSFERTKTGGVKR